MEFLGTAGKWATKLSDVYSDINKDDDAICDVYNWNITEGKANAQLISKAPEMINLLNEIFKCLEYDEMDEHNQCYYKREIFKLIKEATTI